MEGKRRALLAVMFLFALATSISGLYLPLFYLSRGLSVTQIMLLLALTFVALGTAPLLIVGRNTISLGLLFYAVFCILAGSAHPALVGVFYGLALGFFWPSVNYISLKVTGSDDRASFLGLLSAVRTATPIAGVVIGGFLASWLGLSALLIISAAIFFVSFITASYALSGIESEGFARTDKLPFADGNFRIFLTSYFLQGFADSTWLVYPLLLARLAGGSTSEMGLASSAITLISALMFVAIGRFSDSSSRRKPFLLAAVPFEMIWFVGAAVARSVSDLVLFSLFSAVSAALMRTGDSMYADCYERRHHAFMIALRETLLDAGRLAGLFSLSLLILSGNYSAYYFVLAGAAGLYFLVFSQLKERHSYA